MIKDATEGAVYCGQCKNLFNGCTCKPMTQDNLTLEKIRQKALGNDYKRPSVEDVMFLLDQVDTLKLSLSGKTNFDEVAELKRQLESQNEEIERLVYMKSQTATRCAEIADGIAKRCPFTQGYNKYADVYALEIVGAIRTEFQLPKEE